MNNNLEKLWKKSFNAERGGVEYCLATDNDVKIITENNNYLLVKEKLGNRIFEDNLGYSYEMFDDILAAANKVLTIEDDHYKEKNYSRILLQKFVKELSDKKFNPLKLSILNNGLYLPSSSIPKFVVNQFSENSKFLIESEDPIDKIIVSYLHKFVKVDTSKQNHFSAISDENGREMMIDKLTGIKIVNEKNNLYVKNEHSDKKFKIDSATSKKINECLSKEINGISISINNAFTDCTIDLIFVGNVPIIVLNDRKEDYDDIIPNDENVINNIYNDYGVDIPEILGSNSVLFEALGDMVGDEDEFDDESGMEGEGDTADEKSTDDQMGDVDPEIQRETEIIENNILKIEELPEDIRENPSIQEIYLLLLGKKELLQKQHNEEKSQEIIDDIVNDLETELDDIDLLFKDDNSNEIRVEEGKVIEIKGNLLIPMISSTFGKKERLLVVENKNNKIKITHKIPNSLHIRKVINEMSDMSESKILKINCTAETVQELTDKLFDIFIDDFDLWNKISNMSADDKLETTNGRLFSISEVYTDLE